MESLSLVTSRLDDTVVVAARGEIDIATAPQLVAEIEDLVEGGARSVVVDVRAVRFMDARGVGALMAADTRVRDADGRMVVAAAPGRVTRLLEASRAYDVLQISTSVVHAVQLLRQ